MTDQSSPPAETSIVPPHRLPRVCIVPEPKKSRAHGCPKSPKDFQGFVPSRPNGRPIRINGSDSKGPYTVLIGRIDFWSPLNFRSPHCCPALGAAHIRVLRVLLYGATEGQFTQKELLDVWREYSRTSSDPTERQYRRFFRLIEDLALCRFAIARRHPRCLFVTSYPAMSWQFMIANHCRLPSAIVFAFNPFLQRLLLGGRPAARLVNKRTARLPIDGFAGNRESQSHASPSLDSTHEQKDS